MPSLCGVITEAKVTARSQREARHNKPQPWIVLKLMVFVTTGIMIYAGYVYIGRLCVPIILDERTGEGVSKGTGIALLAIFCVLYLWMLWAYARIVLTAPGFARDYITQSSPPALPPPPPIPAPFDQDSLHGPSYEQQGDRNAGVLDAIPHPPVNGTIPFDKVPKSSVNSNSPRKANGLEGKPTSNWRQARVQRDLERAAQKNVTRRPPTTPVFAPQYRYCSKDLFVKPFRAHHCRACGTCVLRYDHHCPWIGQCVGARNHKFFLNFNFATAIFTAYTFGTLVGYTVHFSNTPLPSDPEQIVIIALSGLFFIFTSTLFLSHTRLICLSQTTVEHLHFQTIHEREEHLLSEVFGCWEISAKRRVKKEWDREWGRVGHEGNMWWRGGSLEGWEETMGSRKRTVENPWGWLSWVLPLGLKRRNPEMVGLESEVNPRFDEEGRWKRRSEWPQELR